MLIDVLVFLWDTLGAHIEPFVAHISLCRLSQLRNSTLSYNYPTYSCPNTIDIVTRGLCRSSFVYSPVVPRVLHCQLLFI
jgi:hypothetical protein